MKRITEILFAAAVGLGFFSSCVEEVIQPAEPENDSYGVYFETLSAAQKKVEFDPAEEAVLNFKAMRTAEDDAITVPVVVTATAATSGGNVDASDIFTVSNISFKDGQKETVFSVSFPKAELGVQYNCSIECKDPEYVHIYSDKPTSLSFAVTRVKWVKVTGAGGEQYGTWTDDVISSAFNLPGVYATNDKIEIYERDDKKGYYRITDVYNPYMLSKLFAGQYSEDELVPNCTAGTATFIDATDPAKVWIVEGTTGAILGDDGYISFGSACSDNGFNANNYGMLEDGVITFPVNGVVLWFSVTTGYYNGNRSGKLVITLPGAKVTDYNLKVKAGLSEDGVLPVQFTIGADVAKAKYKIYEGTVSSTDYESKLNDVARDENAAAVTKTTTVGLELAKTGVYTIVTVAMDAQGNVVGNSFDKISYVAKGEEVPVVISAGIGSADKYVPKGFSTDNTLEVWCYGTDITEAYIAVVSLADFTSDPQSAIAKALENPVSEEVLEAINGEGYAAPVTGLVPGTDYKIVVVASNGYELKAIASNATARTTGDPLPIYKDWTIDDFSEEFTPALSEGLFGTYNMYAIDAFEETSVLRAKVATVTIGDSEIEDVIEEENGQQYLNEYVEIKGMFQNPQISFDDTMIWEYSGGGLYYLQNEFGKGTNNDYWFKSGMTTTDGKVYNGDYGLLGITVDDGYIAVICTPGNEQYGFDGIFVRAYKDAGYTENAGGLFWYTNIMFIEASKDTNAGRNAAEAKVRNIKRALKNVRANCVESAEGHKKSIIEAAEKAAGAVKVYTALEGMIERPASREVAFNASTFDGTFESENKADAMKFVGTPAIGMIR